MQTQKEQLNVVLTNTKFFHSTSQGTKQKGSLKIEILDTNSLVYM